MREVPGVSSEEAAQLPDNGGEYLSAREAADRYRLSLPTLTRRLRNGEIPALKERGPRGREWRVSVTALEAFGYVLPEDEQPAQAPDVDELGGAVRQLRTVASFERRRAEEADRRLGEAMQEVGRLRSQLRKSAGDT